MLTAKIPAPAAARTKPLMVAAKLPTKGSVTSPPRATAVAAVSSARGTHRSPPAAAPAPVASAAATSFVASDFNNHDSSDDDRPSADAFPPFANQLPNVRRSLASTLVFFFHPIFSTGSTCTNVFLFREFQSMEAHIKPQEIDWNRFGEVHKLHAEVRACVSERPARLALTFS